MASIGKLTFYGCIGLTSITILESVTIGWETFKGVFFAFFLVGVIPLDKKEKSFQRIVLHHCGFEYTKNLINKVLSLV